MIKFFYNVQGGIDLNKKIYFSPEMEVLDFKKDSVMNIFLSADNDVLWDPLWNDG